MLEQVAIAILRGAGDTVTGLYTKVVVNFVNAVCSAALLLGWGGLPALGWEGLAIGTSIGHAVGAAILLAALIRGRDGIGWRLRELTPDWGLLARMFRVGGPGGLDVLAVLGCHLSYVSIINTLGTDSAAAHGLGVELEAMAYAPASSFAVAASAMTGLLLGANEPRQAGRAILTAAIVAILFCSTMGFIFYHSGWVLVEWFVGESSPRTALLARDYLRIVSFSMPFLVYGLGPDPSPRRGLVGLERVADSDLGRHDQRLESRRPRRLVGDGHRRRDP
jgi:Na+-driven multidrug efflux pump